MLFRAIIKSCSKSGTNELEVLVFRVGELTLGVNVAKGARGVGRQDSVALPEGHASLVGCFQLRDRVVPCVSLHRHLHEPALPGHDAMVILTEFNQQHIGFVVDTVERIHRINWNQVLAAPQLSNDSRSPITAIAHVDGRLVLMLDFEMIAHQVSQRHQAIDAVSNIHGVDRQRARVLVADDSPPRNALEGVLRASGYNTLSIFENGALLWSYLIEQLEMHHDVHRVADLVISDVEMPQIDGLHW